MPQNLELVLRVRGDLDEVLKDLRRLDHQVEVVERSTGGAAGGVSDIGDAAEDAASGIGRMDIAVGAFAANIAAGALARAVDLITDIPAQLIESGREIERLEARFQFASGSFAAGLRDLQFVRQESERLAIDFRTAADAYSALQAAARGTNLEGQATAEIFTAAATAARVLQLDSSRTGLVMRALEQIMSKGVLSAEELRQQMGDHLPGAFQIGARAMGQSVEEFDRAIARGDILSEDFLPRWARQVIEEMGHNVPAAVDTADASFQRLGNAIERLEEATAKSGFLDFLADAADLLADIVDSVSGLEVRTVAEDLKRLVELEATRDRLLSTPRPRQQQQREREIQAVTDEIAELEARLGELGAPAAAAIEAVAGQAREDIGRITQQLQNIRDAEATPRQGRAPGAAPSSVLERRTEELEAQLAAATRELEVAERLLRARTVEPGADLDPIDVEGVSREQERALRRLEALGRQFEDRRLQATRDRIGQVLIAERRALDEIQGLVDEGLVTEEEAEAKRVIIRASGAAQRQRIQEDEEARRERAALAEERRAERAERLAERARRAQAAALQDLAELEASLDGPYASAVASVERWEAAQIAAFEAAGISAEQYGDTVERVVAVRLAEAVTEETDRRLRESKRWVDGARRALADYEDAATDAGAASEEAFTAGLQTMEDAFVEFTRTGKFEFSSLADSIIADLARIATRQAITGPLANALLGAFGSAGGGTFDAGFDFAHGGGVVGSGARHRRLGVPPAVFAGARRLHRGGVAGLRPNEIPYILERGETVRTAEQEAALGRAAPMPVTIIHENRGSPTEVTEAGATLDLEGLIVRVVTGNIDTGGPIGRSIERIVPGTTL